jgi:hypothetical protein
MQTAIEELTVLMMNSRNYNIYDDAGMNAVVGVIQRLRLDPWQFYIIYSWLEHLQEYLIIFPNP